MSYKEYIYDNVINNNSFEIDLSDYNQRKNKYICNNYTTINDLKNTNTIYKCDLNNKINILEKNLKKINDDFNMLKSNISTIDNIKTIVENLDKKILSFDENILKIINKNIDDKTTDIYKTIDKNIDTNNSLILNVLNKNIDTNNSLILNVLNKNIDTNNSILLNVLTKNIDDKTADINNKINDKTSDIYKTLDDKNIVLLTSINNTLNEKTSDIYDKLDVLNNTDLMNKKFSDDLLSDIIEVKKQVLNISNILFTLVKCD